jgi:hypothetical protein
MKLEHVIHKKMLSTINKILIDYFFNIEFLLPIFQYKVFVIVGGLNLLVYEVVSKLLVHAI